MKVILSETVESIGQIGDLVNVAPGYARNFLFPKKLAMEATGKNVRELSTKRGFLRKNAKSNARRCSLMPRNSIKLASRCVGRSRRTTNSTVR